MPADRMVLPSRVLLSLSLSLLLSLSLNGAEHRSVRVPRAETRETRRGGSGDGDGSGGGGGSHS